MIIRSAIVNRPIPAVFITPPAKKPSLPFGRASLPSVPAKPNLSAIGRAQLTDTRPNLSAIGRAQLTDTRPNLSAIGRVAPIALGAIAANVAALQAQQTQGQTQQAQGYSDNTLPPQLPNDAYPPEETAPQQEDNAPPQQQDSAPQEALSPMLDSLLPPDVPQEWESDVDFQEMQGFAGEPLKDARQLMKVFAHVENGQLCTTGICKTLDGSVFPVSHTMPAPSNVEEGAVIAGDDVSFFLDKPLAESMQVLDMQASKDAQAIAAENLVIRARMGDQNAMALIAEVRKNSSKNPRAARSVEIIRDYIARNPVSDNPFGDDATPKKEPESNVLFSACIALANGGPLSSDRIRGMASAFGAEEDEKLFLYAVVNYKRDGLVQAVGHKLGDWGKRIAQFGKGVGLARAIQAVRDPTTLISAFCPDVGWELGE